MELIPLSVGMLATNCYIVACSRTREGLVIDPGEESPVILEALTTRGITLTMIVLTHAHFDHTGAATALREATGAPVAIHANEADLLTRPAALFRGMHPPAPIAVDRVLRTGETLEVGDLSIRVLATPGHSPGGISLYIEREQVVFSGDALFREGIGRSDFPGSSGATLSASIRTQLYTLPEETVVYPGHGPQTTIGWEKHHNPFVRPHS